MFKRFIGLFLLLSFLLTSCSKTHPLPSEKPSILTSIAPYAFFVERIAGDTVEIHTLIPPGTNLHIYEPTPKSVTENIRAKVWFRIDEPIEKPILASFKEQNPLMKVVNLQKGIPLLGEVEAIELTPCTGHHHDHDLHTWLSPKIVLKQAKMIEAALIELLPEHQSLYRSNFKNLERDLKDLNRQIAQTLRPFTGSALLVSHPAFGYFCKEYGLIQLSVECEGKDPRPKDIENILKKAKLYEVRCVFLQEGFNNRGAQLIGQKLQLAYYHVDPYARDYLANMRKISGYIAQ